MNHHDHTGAPWGRGTNRLRPAWSPRREPAPPPTLLDPLWAWWCTMQPTHRGLPGVGCSKHHHHSVTTDFSHVLGSRWCYMEA